VDAGLGETVAGAEGESLEPEPEPEPEPPGGTWQYA
jgi:hypothetical protein